MGGETTEPSIVRYAAGSDGAQVIVATEMGEVQMTFSHFSPRSTALEERATTLSVEVYYEREKDDGREDGIDLELILEASVEDEARQREMALIAVDALLRIRQVHTRESSPS